MLDYTFDTFSKCKLMFYINKLQCYNNNIN